MEEPQIYRYNVTPFASSFVKRFEEDVKKGAVRMYLRYFLCHLLGDQSALIFTAVSHELGLVCVTLTTPGYHDPQRHAQDRSTNDSGYIGNGSFPYVDAK